MTKMNAYLTNGNGGSLFQSQVFSFFINFIHTMKWKLYFS